jgi:hypothetical protein
MFDAGAKTTDLASPTPIAAGGGKSREVGQAYAVARTLAEQLGIQEEVGERKESQAGGVGSWQEVKMMMVVTRSEEEVGVGVIQKEALVVGAVNRQEVRVVVVAVFRREGRVKNRQEVRVVVVLHQDATTA